MAETLNTNEQPTMDFRTYWWSKILFVVMIIMSAAMNLWLIPDVWNVGNVLGFIGYVVGHPFFAVTIATIPVFIICWIMKIVPDLDYCIWLAFIYMLIRLIMFIL